MLFKTVCIEEFEFDYYNKQFNDFSYLPKQKVMAFLLQQSDTAKWIL